MNPMKYKPIHSNFVFEPITTPNKNIQSYFVKNDQSYFTDENSKYPKYGYNDKIIQIVIENNMISIQDRIYKVDFFKKYHLNLEKHKTISQCINSIYALIYEDIKSRGEENKIYKTEQVQLIVGDFFGRSEIIAFVDIILNQLGFKTIMILPASLCASFNMNHNFCAFIFDHGFSFIEDFALIDTFYYNLANNHIKPSARIDDEDFAEEFSRLSVIDERLRYSCDECGMKEENIEKIQSHIIKEHNNGTYYFYESPYENGLYNGFTNRMKYLFSKDKYEKISKNIFYVGTEEIDETKDQIKFTFIKHEDYINYAIKGSQIFSTLEVSKDLWMTDLEWKITRLRILKDKLLFFI